MKAPFRRPATLVVLLVIALAAPSTAQREQSVSGSSRRLAILTIEDRRAAARGDIRVLLEAARSSDPVAQETSVRALGRLERRDVIPDLLESLGTSLPEIRAEAANALAQALRGEPVPDVPGGQQEQTVRDALLQSGAREYDTKSSLEPLEAIARSIGRLPNERIATIKIAEAFLRRVLNRPRGGLRETPWAAAARGLESLARLNRKLAPSWDDETRARLRELTLDRLEPPAVRRNAMSALVALQGVDDDTLRSVLTDPDAEVRRLAVQVVTGDGSRLSDEERLDLIRQSLADESYIVRYEALRAWVRRGVRDQGCQPLVDALGDDSLHVVLAAIDALADGCAGDTQITDRIVSETRTPPPHADWHREAHALVAMAKRAPDRAAVAVPTFAMDGRWGVRLYAVRAAAQLNDVAWLTRLARDVDDNVAEAALPSLRKLLGADAVEILIEALGRRSHDGLGAPPRRPYQVIRTAANELKGSQPTARLVTALVSALQRVTAEKCDTSRDARLALIERIGELGSADQEETLRPLLKDEDPEVAAAAAAVIARWTGRPPPIEPAPRAQGPLPTEHELSRQDIALVELERGRQFSVAFRNDEAPLTVARFVGLAKAHYYDGTTFHRVVPNFVIQGGGPNANEYCGDCPFMRDEPGLLMHVRGSVGISTRGRDTGDAQIFINLVDNARLDHEYTVFADVCSGMDAVDRVQEAEVIRRITIRPRSPSGC
jgi:cyclophilin family peptidyl-prolyl cis-trans isomerase/HEAT repeat protein